MTVNTIVSGKPTASVLASNGKCLLADCRSVLQLGAARSQAAG